MRTTIISALSLSSIALVFASAQSRVLTHPKAKDNHEGTFHPAAGASKSSDASASAATDAPTPLPSTPRKLNSAEHVRRIPDFIREEELQEMFSYKGPRMTARSVGRSADEQTSYLAVRRTESSGTEVHARWDDIVIVRAGRGALLVGEQMIGGRTLSVGEHRDGTIVKPAQYVLSPGNIVRVPAGVPHSFVVQPGTALEYLLIKQRRLPSAK